MTFTRRITPNDNGATLTTLLEEHLDLVSGGANPGPGCSHDSRSCGPSHNSNTTCQKLE
ncbi:MULTISPECIES: hypothetical protein [Paracoccus]|uniref:Uncharacterized protein n=1 Tax=Paracoccus aerius TaxID=1915382 RepID=A0ABS1S8B6_9RHOB|nr:MULTISPECIES: hypothetical protein [Paracoccus]MBL3674972.1 hypothetical protein [Paracoccus aerius]GHG34742.1 hypothetical protein GCM10017322_37040 [Paracoccus aerius]